MCYSIGTSYLADLYLTESLKRIIWSTTSSQLYTEENDTHITWAPSPLTGVHIVSSQTIHPSHGHTTFHFRLRENDTPSSWASSLHRGTQFSFSVSKRNNTPISWAHPTHGLSLRPTHLVCVVEDVSRSCNHQQTSWCKK